MKTATEGTPGKFLQVSLSNHLEDDIRLTSLPLCFSRSYKSDWIYTQSNNFIKRFM